MKKRSLVIIGAMLIFLTACQQENISEEIETSEVVLEQDNTNLQAKASGEFCRFTLQFNARSEYDVATGKQKCMNHLGSICAIVACFPNPDIIFEIPPVIWDPCQIIPCGLDFRDPWVIYERINPLEFKSFKDVYNLRLDEKSEGIPFALNENVLGIQFYKHPETSIVNDAIMYGDPNPQPSIFYLEKEIALDRDVAKKLGLRGNSIQAGKYPIVFNKENKTYNLMVVVENGF